LALSAVYEELKLSGFKSITVSLKRKQGQCSIELHSYADTQLCAGNSHVASYSAAFGMYRAATFGQRAHGDQLVTSWVCEGDLPAGLYALHLLAAENSGSFDLGRALCAA